MTCSYSVKLLNLEDSERLDKIFGVKDALVEYNPGKCILPPLHMKIAQDVIDAQVREDDVWLVSFPRTGSTWCQEMIWLIGNNLDFDAARNTIQQVRAPLLEMTSCLFEFHETLGDMLENSVDYINNLPSPRFIKSHLPLDLLPSQLMKIKPKIIYTCRNPKDLCVSYYHHCQMIHDLNATFEEFCDLFMKGLTPLGSVWRHYLQFWNLRDEDHILFIKYEDMKRDLRGTLFKIAEFLNKELLDEDYDKLCDFLSFEKMRENRGCNLAALVEEKAGKDYFQKTGKHFIRKGIVGDWKNHMSAEMAKRFDDWIEENSRGTGLTFE